MLDFAVLSAAGIFAAKVVSYPLVVAQIASGWFDEQFPGGAVVLVTVLVVPVVVVVVERDAVAAVVLDAAVVVLGAVTAVVVVAAVELMVALPLKLVAAVSEAGAE